MKYVLPSCDYGIIGADKYSLFLSSLLCLSLISMFLSYAHIHKQR